MFSHVRSQVKPPSKKLSTTRNLALIFFSLRTHRATDTSLTGVFHSLSFTPSPAASLQSQAQNLLCNNNTRNLAFHVTRSSSQDSTGVVADPTLLLPLYLRPDIFFPSPFVQISPSSLPLSKYLPPPSLRPDISFLSSFVSMAACIKPQAPKSPPQKKKTSFMYVHTLTHMSSLSVRPHRSLYVGSIGCVFFFYSDSILYAPPNSKLRKILSDPTKRRQAQTDT